MSLHGGLQNRDVRHSSEALERLRSLLREEGGLIASLVDDGDGNGKGRDGDDGGSPSGASPARAAADGPRAEGRREEYELLVEAIYEGYLLHYGAPRVVRTREADLRVLAGDRLYAIGLARLVALGDTLAVAELADTITLSALAQGAGDEALAEAVWAAGARAVGWGRSEQHARAKKLMAAGSAEAIEAMRTSVLAAPSTP
ncbi:MAG TPA: hypothetical protein VGI27_09575 [Solirubrobacteraceae bacterium]